MTAIILKQDPNTKKVKKNSVYYDKIQHANFWATRLFQATKQHFNGEECDVGYLSAFG